MDTDGIVRRFLHERRILAGLAHPNIARLYDGGSTADGRPYFVMEYVEGEPLTRFAAARGLGVEARLALFLKVCAAVQYAHQRLIVHRDLKPANILVGADGEPKLLDFGIAKLLDATGFDGSNGPPELTEAHQRPMTPDYASPEQLEGGAVTTATDVYGLGILLYELLVGQSPAAVERRLGAGWADRPASQAARALKDDADGQRLARRLRGDLDTIVATARERSVARRYGTAAALAEDVERHLTRRPVAARRPTLPYRLGRAVARHKLASAFILFLVLFAATAAWQAYEIDRQRERAAALSGFLQGLFRGSDPEQARGSSLTVRELLDRGARRLLDRPGGEPQEWRADFLTTVGEVYGNLGLYDDAGKYLHRALDLRSRQTGREAEGETVHLHTLLGHVAWERGDLPAAQRLYERAIAGNRRLHGSRALPLAEDLNGLGLVTAEAGDMGRAADCFKEAVAIGRGAGRAGRKELADGLNNQGWLARRQGDLATAQARFQESLALSRQVLGEDHPETVRVRSNLASLLFQRGDLERAESVYGEILAVRRHLLGPDHPDIARTLNSLGAVREKRGRLEAARGSFLEALAMCRRLNPPAERMAGTSLAGLAAISREQGDLAAAERAYGESCELFRRHAGDDPPGFANALLGQAMVRRDLGHRTAAASGLRQGIDLLASLGGAEPQIARARKLLAELEAPARAPD